MSRFSDELVNVRWPLSASELRYRGVTKSALAGRRWRRTARGMHRPAADDPVTTTQRIVDAAAFLPAGAAIAGWAAAFVHGVDFLDGRNDFTMEQLPVCVRMPPGFHRRSTRLVRYVQPARSITLHTVSGFPVTPLYVAALDLARWAPDIVEAVVGLDAVVGSSLLTSAELITDGPAAGPGSRQVNRAIELAQPGVRSPWETRLRMFCILELGFPALAINQPLFDREGQFLGVPDLFDDDAGLVIEYDGSRWSTGISSGHRDPDQHRRDNHREERFERANLVVVRVDKTDLTRERGRLAVRLRSGRADGLRRDRARDRWTLPEPPTWWGLPA